MSEIVALLDAHDVALFGSKAVGLGQALRDGLPVPPGVALSGAVVEAHEPTVPVGAIVVFVLDALVMFGLARLADLVTAGSHPALRTERG